MSKIKKFFQKKSVAIVTLVGAIIAATNIGILRSGVVDSFGFGSVFLLSSLIVTGVGVAGIVKGVSMSKESIKLSNPDAKPKASVNQQEQPKLNANNTANFSGFGQFNSNPSANPYSKTAKNGANPYSSTTRTSAGKGGNYYGKQYNSSPTGDVRDGATNNPYNGNISYNQNNANYQNNGRYQNGGNFNINSGYQNNGNINNNGGYQNNGNFNNNSAYQNNTNYRNNNQNNGNFGNNGYPNNGNYQNNNYRNNGNFGNTNYNAGNTAYNSNGTSNQNVQQGAYYQGSGSGQSSKAGNNVQSGGYYGSKKHTVKDAKTKSGLDESAQSNYFDNAAGESSYRSGPLKK